MTRNFLLGLGAQKAGTTWLYQYLYRHPACAMGEIKEIGALAGLFAAKAEPRAPNLTRLSEAIENFQTGKNKKRPKNGEDTERLRAGLLAAMDVLAMELDGGRYMTYFDRLMAARPGAVLTGDITPLYSTLTVAELAKTRQMLQQAGYQPRVVFLMRDPVERCFSALRMGDRNLATAAKTTHKAPAHERLAAGAILPSSEARTRYEQILPAIEAVFAPSEIFTALYEEMFDAAEIERLCRFLGIAYMTPNLEHRANASPRPAEPSQGDVAVVRQFYDATYRFAVERFGSARIARAWSHATEV